MLAKQPIQEVHQKITTVRDYFHKVHWNECPAPLTCKFITVDLTSLYYSSLTEYKDEKNLYPMELVSDYINNKLSKIIFRKMCIKLNAIQKLFKVNVIGKENFQVHNPDDVPNIKYFPLRDIKDVKCFRNSIVSYLYSNDQVYEDLQYLIEESGVLINKVTDKSITCSLSEHPVLTYDAHVLVFGKPIIYKFEKNKWFQKTRNEFKDFLKMSKTDNFLYTCILLGTKYANRPDGVNLRSIRKMENKKDNMEKLLNETNNTELLNFVNDLTKKGIN